MEILEISKKFHLDILGPTPALIPYKKNHYQENFYFKQSNYTQIRSNIGIINQHLSPKNKRFLIIDIDPLSIA